MTVQEFQALMIAAQIKVCALTVLVVLGDMALIRLQRRFGKRTVRNYLVAIAVALSLSSGLNQALHARAVRIERPHAYPSVLRAAGYLPYCEGWWWYTDAICWLGEL